MQSKSDIEVTVIVPIYNSEAYLCRCLDSLVFQTLKNLEIIAINNGSTDNSEKILKKYKEAFPDRVFYYNLPHSEFIGRGRNYAISKARGRYVGFCDSDDIADLDYYENLYNSAIDNGSDLVYAPFYYCKNGAINTIYQFDNDIDKKRLILDGNVSTWNKLYEKALLLRTAPQPEDFCFEDFAWFVTLLTKAKKVCYCNKPGYYYIIRENSEANSYVSSKMLGLVAACEFSEAHCDSKYLEDVKLGNIKRIAGGLDVRWPYYDAFARYLTKTVKSIPDSELMSLGLNTYEKVKDCCQSSVEEAPMVVYIEDFQDRITDDMLSELEKRCYFEGGKVIKLNADNCDINVNSVIKQAYEQGDYKFIGSYFALKNIYENGGIYLNNDLEIDSIFNYLRHINCFFAYENKTDVSDSIFGAKAKQTVIHKILETYEDDSLPANKLYYPLAKRIKMILTKHFSLVLDGETCIKDDFSIYAPHVFMFNAPKITQRYSPNLHFTHKAINNYAEAMKVFDVISQYNTLKYKESNSLSNIEEVKKKLVLAEQALAEIKNSNSYQVGLKIKKIMKKPIFRPIYALFMRMRKKRIVQ